MGAIVFTLDSEKPAPSGNQLIVSGYATFSSSYGPTFETYDPADFGLQVCTRILFGPATDGGSPPTGYVVAPLNLTPVFSTKLAGGLPLGQVALLEAPASGPGALTDVADNTPVDSFTAPFVAYGS